MKDLLDLISGSGNNFLQNLFPDRPDPNSKKRPPTAGDRIKVNVLLSVWTPLMFYLAIRRRSRGEFVPRSAFLYTHHQTQPTSKRHWIWYPSHLASNQVFGVTREYSGPSSRFRISQHFWEDGWAILSIITCYFLCRRLYLDRRCKVWLLAYTDWYWYCERRMANGSHESFHQESRNSPSHLDPCNDCVHTQINSYSYLLSKLCEIVIGIIWLQGSKELGATMCATETNVLEGSKDSGKIIKKASNMHKLGIMVIKSWREEKNVDDLAFLAIDVSWAII